MQFVSCLLTYCVVLARLGVLRYLDYLVDCFGLVDACCLLFNGVVYLVLIWLFVV